MSRGHPELRLGVAAMGAVVLTATSLGAVFTSYEWVRAAVLAAAVAFAVGALGRRLEVPTLLAPGLSALGLAVFVTAVFAPATAVLRIIPTGATVDAVAASLRAAGNDIRTLVAPVDVSPDLRLVAAAGVYAVAALVDLLVFRLSRVSAAGLPLLALFAVPAALSSGGVGLAPFVLGCAGYLLLLLAESRHRLGRWGRRLDYEVSPDGLPRLTSFHRLGRRLGGAAIAAAIVVPGLLPSLGGGLLGTGPDGGHGGRGGSTSAATYNPITHLKRDLVLDKPRELMRVRTARPAYLRLTSLDYFDGSTWRQSDDLEAGEDQRVSRKRGLPEPDGLTTAPRETATYDVRVDSLDVRWLPAPYAPQQVSVKGDWRYDERSLTVFSTRKTTRKLSYSLTSTLANPTPDELAAVPAEEFADGDAERQLPPNLPSLLYETLQEWIAGAQTPYERVLAIQDHLRGPEFAYDVRVPQGNGLDALSSFLTGRRGYCEQFAAVMAVMVRALGLRARVAIGFTPGRLRPDGEYSISNRDAHSWPEVFFPGAGWLAFEPTPRTDSPVAPASYAATTTRGGDAGAAPRPGDAGRPTATAAPSARPNQAANALERQLDNAPTDAAAGRTGGRRSAAPWVAAGVVVLVLCAVAPGIGRRVYWRRRWRAASTPVARAHTAWDQLADDARDAGLGWRASDSPRAAARRLVEDASLSADATAAVAVLASAAERARYARTFATTDDLMAAAHRARTALLGQLSARGRAAAIVLPPSALGRAQRWTVTAYDAVQQRRQRFVSRVLAPLPGPVRRAFDRA
ncbi:MAG: transglutaminaseTgpA domain-containing protein [Mycobacteriales bacterium]|nr:transglutaminaseTgpA domain-containing protein [Frankia sp.]